MVRDDIQQQVRQFYDQVGWQADAQGLYQNMRYEDLRPVAQAYIHACHLRVNRHLQPQGRFFLDAGSGPVQYPEYLTYSQGYARRVCVDLSIVALQEARRRVGSHGLYVVCDVTCLPFKSNVFDGAASLHTLHHVPAAQQRQGYLEILRVLAPGKTAVIVNGWTESPLMQLALPLVRLMEGIGKRMAARRKNRQPADAPAALQEAEKKPSGEPTGTFIAKTSAAWLRRELHEVEFEIFVWRSVNVRFLRALIHRQLGGRLWLGLLYGLEERFPHFFGEKGQYPLIVVKKPALS